jgi:hypothetical protein
MNANSRKWADRPLFWPIFMLFVVIPPFSALRGPLTAFRPRTSGFGPRPPLQPRCDSFSAQKTHFAAVFRSHRPPRGPFCEIGITRRLKTGIKPISRGFSTGLATPYSHSPQPIAPLTRRHHSAIILSLSRHIQPTSGRPNETVRIMRNRVHHAACEHLKNENDKMAFRTCYILQPKATVFSHISYEMEVAALWSLFQMATCPPIRKARPD